MSRRGHAALWIAGIVIALLGVPLAPDASRDLEARTQSLLARIDPRIASAAASRAHAITAPWVGTPTADRRADMSSKPGFVQAFMSRWWITWRIVIFRLALVACAGVVWVPIVAAGALDGLALRHARRSRLAAASPVAVAAGIHVSIGLAFAPVMWAALPLDAEPLVLAAWALTLSGTLSFTLSRAGSGGAP